MDDHDQTATRAGVKRRTVAKGMAWTVPVISVAAAAPAYAVSPEDCTIVFGGDSCKCAGQSQPGNEFGYYLQFCYTCEGGEPPEGDITITSVVKSNGSLFTPTAGCGFPAMTFPYTFDSSGCSQTFRFIGTNSGNFIAVSYQVGDGPVETVRLPSPPDCTGAVGTSRCEACATPQ
jgi:hypothetical protein